VTVVETALRATYHLAGNDALRLRRMTRESGLEAENVLSRLAIVESIAAGSQGPFADYQPSQRGRTKEIKGNVLLGRPRQAALILALLARSQDGGFNDPRAALMWHWARGLRLLDARAPEGDVLHVLAEQLASKPVSAPDDGRRARRSGLGGGIRDELAAAVGRQVPRWPTEVRRIVAMVARLDPDRLDATVERFSAEAGLRDRSAVLSEKVALRIMHDKWKLNRLGLDVEDREMFRRILAGEQVTADEHSVPFLKGLGLVTNDRSGVRPSTMGRRLGEEAIQP